MTDLRDKKYCGRCREWKRETDFYMRWRRHRRTGEKVYYRESMCKRCKVAQAKAWKEAHPERAREHYRKHERSPRRARYRRDYYRMNYGKGKFMWTKYRDEGSDQRLPVDPFREWLGRELKDRGLSRRELEEVAGLASGQIRAILDRYDRVSVSVVDKITVALDRPEVLAVLYAEG